MDAAALLAELEAKTHAARWRRMVDLGRAAAAADVDARATLHALGTSDDAYARTLLVASLYGSRDGSLALRLLDDPSRSVRRLAAAAVPLVCDDAQATDALARVDTARARTQLAKALRARRRLGPLDAWFERVQAELREDKSAVDTLPFASASWRRPSRPSRARADRSPGNAWQRCILHVSAGTRRRRSAATPARA